MTHLAITTYATSRYAYALEEQAPLLLAALRYAQIPLDLVRWIYASDGSQQAQAAFKAVRAALPEAVVCQHLCLTGLNESPDGQHETASNLTIARLQAAAWHAARCAGASHVWSVESDILPNPNTLRTLLDTVSFDRGWYDVAMAGYPNAAFLGGHGDPQHWIAPTVYEDERLLPDDLRAALDARAERMRTGPPPTEEEEEQWRELDKQVEAAPPKGNPFGLQAAGWRPRGWLESAYPGIGQGAVLPTHWVGLGCTLLTGRALDLANWTGYEGKGTQDLWLCWRCWHPAGLRLAVVPHALCSHVKRQGDSGFVTWFARHELGGPCHGHLRVDTLTRANLPRTSSTRQQFKSDASPVPSTRSFRS
jgi:hypothetical protein